MDVFPTVPGVEPSVGVPAHGGSSVSDRALDLVVRWWGPAVICLMLALCIAFGHFSLAIALLFCTCFSALFFAHPKVAVAIILAARANLHLVRVEPLYGLGVDGILNLWLVALGIVYVLMNKRRVEWPRQLKAVNLFMLFALCSVVWSEARWLTARWVLRLPGYVVLLFVILGEFRSRRDVVILLCMLFASSMPNILYALFSFVRSPDVFLGERQRLGGLSYYCPWLVGQYAMCLGTILAWVLATARRLRPALLLLLFILMLVMLLSKTRVAILAFALTNVPILLAQRSVPTARKLGIMLVVAVSVGMVAPALIRRFEDVVRQSGTARPWGEFDPDNSLEWRWRLWQAELRYVEPYLLLGSGFGTIQWYNAFINEEIGYAVSGHGEYLQSLIELGVPGLLLTVAMELSLHLCGWRLLRRLGAGGLGMALAGALTAITGQWMLISFTDDFMNSLPSMTTLFVLIGMLEVYRRELAGDAWRGEREEPCTVKLWVGAPPERVA